MRRMRSVDVNGILKYKEQPQMYILTKRVRFCCSHRLYRDDWTAEQNRNVYGPCTNLHGHNYVLEVSVRGDVDTQSGMIINLNILGKHLTDEIVNRIDHTNLNTDIEEFKTRVPTLENMVDVFWDWLDGVLPDGVLEKITLYETENNKIEYWR